MCPVKEMLDSCVVHIYVKFKLGRWLFFFDHRRAVS
jgi:hypothetical protein